MNTILRDVFLGFIRAHVLYHAAKERIYGAEMIDELARHGYEVSPGTIYPMLHGLEKAGYLSSEPELAGGKVRKYYRITPAGRKAFKDLKSKIREMTDEILGRSDDKKEDRSPARAKPARRSGISES